MTWVAILEWVFWADVAAVVFVTIGYPVFLVLAAPFVRRHQVQDSLEPTVSLVIAAYNEERVLAQKLENSLALDYPREKLEIIVASDGSSDGTNGIARSYADRGVLLEAFPRTGKTGVQNEMARRARGEILVFSDANAMYRPDAIRKLVRNFADPAVGGVCGQLVYTTEGEGAGASESAYWRYEKFMKLRESGLSSVVGANGSIYAIRRSDYVPLSPDLISDLVEPLAIVSRGKRVIYEPDAISVEAASGTYQGEFRRKVRILTRSIRGVWSMRALLNPLRYGVFSFQLLLHKVLRFVTPAFLIAGALALVLLAALGRYRLLLAVVLIGALVTTWVATRPARQSSGVFVRLCHLCFYYAMANYALVLAWSNVIRGNRMALWSPERARS